jgi:chromatin segregation and condensation protein Rec8/ScpA/Scc1 (kleisin family)
MFCIKFYADLAEIKYGPAEDLCHDILGHMEEKDCTYVQLWDNINETVDHVVNRFSAVLHVWQQHRQCVMYQLEQTSQKFA